MTELSEYERIRLENIARNESFLKEIGLPQQSKKRSGAEKRKASAMTNRRKERVHIEGERRSSRIRNTPAELKGLSYTESDDDELFDEKQSSSSKADSSRIRNKVSSREVVIYETKVVNMSASKASREVDSNYGIFIGCDASFEHLRYDESTGTLSGPQKESSVCFREENGKWLRITDGDNGKKWKEQIKIATLGTIIVAEC